MNRNVPMYANSDAQKFDAEAALINALGVKAAQVDDGSTNYETRMERVRAVIRENSLADIATVIGEGSSRSETFAAAFQRVYGQPL